MSWHVEFDAYLEQVRQQAGALRAAAVKAGPDADVPTAPGWIVRRLVGHIARVHSWVVLSFDADPAGEAPVAAKPPEDWETLLTYWDAQLAALLDGFRRRGPAAPVWTFDGAGTTAWWARRQAHETAIHRLDAEHAAHGDAVDHLAFDPEFAADGIDEAVTSMFGRRTIEVSGTVLYHAADAGRAWLVTATTGQPLVVEAATDFEADASVVGTADAVYRAVWGRPSNAIVGGNAELAAGLRTP